MAGMNRKDPLYGPFNKESSIRLLSIKPGYTTDKLECALVVIDNLEEAPPYQALSYVWGTEQNTETILCNGYEKAVTVNLFHALRHLRSLPSWNYQNVWDKKHRLHSQRNVWRDFAKHRYEDYGKLEPSDRLFWIDALCIDQNNPHEQASQVKLMRSIYKKASLVRIWFGSEDTHHLSEPEVKGWGNRLVAKVAPRHHIGNYGDVPVLLTFIAQALKNIEGANNRLVSMKSSDDTAFRNQSFGLPPPSATEWSVVRDFFSHPWHSRAWVMQEVVLAEQATAFLGDWEIQWSAVGKAASWFQQKGYNLPPDVEYKPSELHDFMPVSSAAAIWNMSFAPDKQVALLDLLRESRNRLSSKNVDKFYAVLGLAIEVNSGRGDQYDALIEPDYSKPIDEVFRDLTRFLIAQHNNLDVLSHAGGTEDHPGWPSWVPRWHEGKPSKDYAHRNLKDIQCAGTTEPLTPGTPSSPNILLLKGIEIDTIQSFNERLTSYGFGTQVHQEEREFVLHAWDIFQHQTHNQQSLPYSSPRETALAFISTMTAGLSNLGLPTHLDLHHQRDAARWFAKHLRNKVSATTWFEHLSHIFAGKPDASRFHEAFLAACRGRRFFVSKKGYMGMGPQGLKEGDSVVVAFGAQVPFVIRRGNGAGEMYRFVGDCYVPGLMRGEAVERWRETGELAKWFELA
jgi:hypothetical protein